MDINILEHYTIEISNIDIYGYTWISIHWSNILLRYPKKYRCTLDINIL